MLVQQKTKLKKKNDFADVISNAKQILNEYDLCEHCVGRLFAKNLSLTSNKLLGKKIKKLLKAKKISKCYICKNILSNLQPHLDTMFEKSQDYQFSTFLVGAKLQPSITDKDDVIRSKFKLRGTDSVKTDITKQLAKKFAKKTEAKIDYHYPDLTIMIDFKNDYCELIIRPLIFYGRYIKKIRGIPQKQTRCKSCLGLGCYSCNFHGISEYESVEGKISKFLFSKLGGTQVKMTWIGGEDRTSLVLGNGRPFFVKLLDPKKRKLTSKAKFSQDGIIIKNIRVIDQIPKEPLQFYSKVFLSIKTKKKIGINDVKKINALKKTRIVISDNRKKQVQKLIYSIISKKNSSNSFSMRLTIDGGAPIKQFVEGNNVSPSLTEIIGNQCKCNQFDIQDIKLLN